MKRKTHQNKLTARVPQALGEDYRVMLIKEGVFFLENGLKGYIEDVLAAVVRDFLLRPLHERRAILKKRMPEVARMRDEEGDCPLVDGAAEHSTAIAHKILDGSRIDGKRVDGAIKKLRTPKR